MKPDYIAGQHADWESAFVAPVSATVPPSLAGLRLDQALARLFPQYSRNRLQAWLRSGHIRFDGERAEPRRPVAGGERIDLAPPVPPAAAAPRAQKIPLAVVYEDRDLIVIDKPAGLVVHPGAGVPDRTLLNALLAHAPALAGVPRAGIVHRLDKDTSGLLVVAKNVSAQAALAEQLSSRAVRRVYLALVHGDPPARRPIVGESSSRLVALLDQYLDRLLTGMLKSMFGEGVVPADVKASLAEVAIESCLTDWMAPGVPKTGIVFAGFSHNEVRPSFLEIKVGSAFGGIVKHELVEGGSPTQREPAIIRSFAQADLIDALLRGAQPGYRYVIFQLMRQGIGALLNAVGGEIAKKDANLAKSVLTMFDQAPLAVARAIIMAGDDIARHAMEMRVAEVVSSAAPELLADYAGKLAHDYGSCQPGYVACVDTTAKEGKEEAFMMKAFSGPALCYSVTLSLAFSLLYSVSVSLDGSSIFFPAAFMPAFILSPASSMSFFIFLAVSPMMLA